MYKAIKSTYEKLQAAVRLNGSLTDWFSVEAGVRQGDNLAPTLFAVFVDDLVTEINRIGKGINIGTDSLSCLLYADDIVLISDTVDGLQSLLHCVTDWSKTWRLKVNTDKTKIMHVRKASKPKNDYEFQLNNMTLETVSKYRYLGLVITENLDYKETTNELVSSGSRSLGSLVSKYYAMDGMDFDTYTKIFDSTVLPILEYGSGVWGHKRYDSLERLQYRAIRTFLGVSLTTPIPAITGDMGWYPVHHRIQVNIVRLYCRLVKLPDTRICRKVFVWDQNISTRYRDTWFNHAKKLFDSCGLSDVFFLENQHIITPYLIDSVKTHLENEHKQSWLNNIQQMPKLRTYKLFKTEFETETFLKRCLTRSQRSSISRMRCGTFPLEIEKGRVRNIPVERRTCKMCDTNSVEDEIHFLIHCPKYTEKRNKLFENICVTFRNISGLSDTDKLCELLSNHKLSKLVANFIADCYHIRTLTL
ncbi:unnamed protein product [Mytilus edulis]|uniref:Reverse transcriptase domain-containing protein n=1 Tax=Mytilus edulis TaxID=6550 RepID=A0A8S3RMN6_MYTED|nr:unnamed protein product [Mytilus edulis]